MKNLIYLFALLPFFVFGQQKTDKNSLWTVGIVFSPDHYIPPIGISGGPGIYQTSAYRIGISGVCDFEDNPHWSIRSGIRYVVYNQRLEYSLGLYDPRLYPQTVVKFKKLNFVDVPLFMRYTFGKTKLRLYAEVGGGLDVLPNTEQEKTIIYWGVSLGLEYRFYNRFSIFAQPLVRKAFARNNTYFLSSGIEMGVKLRLSER
jgi:hypothetical protein